MELTGLDAPLLPVAADSLQAGVIAADVGGTYARLGWVAPAGDGRLQLRHFRKYACAEHPGLAAIIADFAGSLPGGDGLGELRACVAIAGVRDGDVWVNSNLPWPVSLSATRREAGLASLELINDFQALAYAIAHADVATMSRLAGSGEHRFRWPALVLGPGTGLGAAVRFEDGERPVLASEVGHAALAAGNALELEVLKRLLERWPHVGNERVLSGTGLLNLYRCLCRMHGVAPAWDSTAALVQAANAGHDAVAVQTLRAFCEWLGSAVGDLAVTFGVRSVYLAGGISGHVRNWLCEGGFERRYRNKGVLSHVVAQVPVWLVEHGELAVIGAAAWHYRRHDDH